MASIILRKPFAQMYAQRNATDGFSNRRHLIKSFKVGENPSNKNPHRPIEYPEDYDFKAEANWAPEFRIGRLCTVFGFCLTRLQSNYISWLENIGSTMQKLVTKSFKMLNINAPSFGHLNYRNRINRLISKLWGGGLSLVCALATVLIGVLFSKNKQLLEENKDLFLNAYFHHKNEIAVERRWLWQVLAPYLMISKLGSKFVQGAHEMFAGIVGAAPGAGFEETDKLAKNNPAALLSAGNYKMWDVSKFSYNLVKKQNTWAEYIKTLPENEQRLDDNFINLMYSQVEGLTDLMKTFNLDYSKESIKKSISYIARDAERNADQADKHWKGIESCIDYAKNHLSLDADKRQELNRAYHNIYKSSKEINMSNNIMHAVSHAIHFINLASYGSADELWNQENGVVHHYEIAKKYGDEIPALVPDWAGMMYAWAKRNPEQAQKAVQTYGQPTPTEPIVL